MLLKITCLLSFPAEICQSKVERIFIFFFGLNLFVLDMLFTLYFHGYHATSDEKFVEFSTLKLLCKSKNLHLHPQFVDSHPKRDKTKLCVGDFLNAGRTIFIEALKLRIFYLTSTLKSITL
jgi:hypothetical protein